MSSQWHTSSGEDEPQEGLEKWRRKPWNCQSTNPWSAQRLLAAHVNLPPSIPLYARLRRDTHSLFYSVARQALGSRAWWQNWRPTHTPGDSWSFRGTALSTWRTWGIISMRPERGRKHSNT